jgi:UDP-N-acetylmuramoylalanine--D-glutamate ligase
VLELSSWQLGDLKGKGILAPSVSAFTVILPDHLDKYTGMAEYVADKKVMFEAQGPDGKAVFNYDDPWQREFPHETRARSFHYSSKALPPGLPGAWLEGSEGKAKTTLGHGPSKTILSSARIPGDHNRMNLLCAGLALALFGVKAEVVRKALAEFPGVEHRLELFLQWRGIRFYNDSAATIPHATVRALKTVEQPVVLIAGGTDKNIDFSPLAEVARVPHAVVLLDGTATPKIRSVLEAQGAACEGPFGDLREAVEAAVSRANEEGCILFSPGCASFGMFVNEFDRGRKFKETAAGLAAEDRAARG